MSEKQTDTLPISHHYITAAEVQDASTYPVPSAAAEIEAYAHQQALIAAANLAAEQHQQVVLAAAEQYRQAVLAAHVKAADGIWRVLEEVQKLREAVEIVAASEI